MGISVISWNFICTYVILWGSNKLYSCGGSNKLYSCGQVGYRYMRGFLILDVMACIPYDIILIAFCR